MKPFSERPAKIQLRMLEAQKEQGNESNSEIFMNITSAPSIMGGFDWYLTNEGEDAWELAIDNDDYSLLYEANPSLRPDNEEPCNSPE